MADKKGSDPSDIDSISGDLKKSFDKSNTVFDKDDSEF